MEKIAPKLARKQRTPGFTLIELLVVITIIGILTSILLSIFGVVGQRARETETLSNMRQFGTAALLYCADNNNRMPNRAVAQPGEAQPDKWPVLFHPYIQDLRAYTSPIPDVNGKSYKVTDPTLLLSNTANYSSYIINGYNDLNALNDSSVYPQLNNIPSPTHTIMFGIPYPQINQFYMDFSEGAGNNNEVLNRNAFQGTSVWVFFDGSSRVLTYNPKDTMNAAPKDSSSYTDWLWLINKSDTGIIQ